MKIRGISHVLDPYDTLSKLIHKSCILSGEFYLVLYIYTNIKFTQFYQVRYVQQRSSRTYVKEKDTAARSILESLFRGQICGNRSRWSLTSINELLHYSMIV